MEEQLKHLPDLDYSEYSPEETALVIVDLVNGFTTCGNLMTPRLGEKVPAVAQLASDFLNKNFPVVALADTHPPDSPEFLAFPVHCLAEHVESELAPELKAIPGIEVLEKNSTNGFLAPAFQQFLSRHPKLKRFILVGGCTDICVLQLALTLKAHFNEKNAVSEIIVLQDLVDTFDMEGHDAEVVNLLSFFLMQGLDIKLMNSTINI